MVVVVVSMSGEDGALVSGPDIITRGFVYVKESEGLMEELRRVAVEALERCERTHTTDWTSIKGRSKTTSPASSIKRPKDPP